MKCPTCGCEDFFIKDKDDEYEIHEFSAMYGKIEFKDSLDQQGIPEITKEVETFCNRCPWHGTFETLK